MKVIRLLVFGISVLLATDALSQKTTINPTITPALFTATTSITVVYDVTGTPLASLDSAWAWVWIPGASDAKSNVDPVGPASKPAKFVKSTAGGKTTFTLSFVPANFFAASISTAKQMGILIKSRAFSGGQQSTDFLTSFWDGSFQTKLTSPLQNPLFVSNGDVITIAAETPVIADFTLTLNNKIITTQTGITDFSYQLTVNDSIRGYLVTITATASGKSSSTSFTYTIPGASPVLPRPAGIIDGINYSADLTKVTLSLWAPQKTSVYLLGDFNNWQVNSAYEMNHDGEHFWLEVNGLTAGTEYGFQYLVDQTVFVADPYADKILDYGNDPGIPATTYPNLKAYPTGAVHSQEYFNRVAVFQTGQTPYAWKTTNFQKPAKEKLVIYELLIRDFFDINNRNYQNLIDTIGYLKHLGVNAIELMPITEFSGNDSWGYNPTFMLAPDKYYGTKNKLKEFVDLCHQNGIAVIMDIVMNQQDQSNPYVLMYYDFSANAPTAQSPWFNVTAPHPFSVFYDLNHESKYTQAYLDTINNYWANQYKIDGYRYDLSKGFTQTSNPDNVTAWGLYDPSRVAILERMADVLWSHNPDHYIILEHFAENKEETILANYRVDEGKGMMLWENYNNAYAQTSMGFADQSDISAENYVSKGWTKPREVSYMESHDEERIMYKNLTFGNASGSYNTRTLATALNRIKASALLFYSIPGPKMLWEFGEVGYDQTINLCSDNSVSTDCRVTAKPVHWEYKKDPQRAALLAHVTDLMRMIKGFGVFSQGDVSVTSGNVLTKQITIKNKPFTATPTDSTQMNVQIVANMDVTLQSGLVVFPHTGNWFEYYTGTTLSVTAATQAVPLAAGEYRMYTDVKITKPKSTVITGLEEKPLANIGIYPNPSSDKLSVETDFPVTSLQVRTMQGTLLSPPRVSGNVWDVHELATGVYIAEVLVNGKLTRVKFIKR